MPEKRDDVVREIGTGDRRVAKVDQTKMLRSRRSTGAKTNDELVGLVRIQIDDLDWFVRGEAVIGAANRREVIPTLIENEKIVVGRRAAGIERVVPLKDDFP